MVLSGVPMHKSIARAAAIGVVVGLPATIVAAFASTPSQAADIGSINLSKRLRGKPEGIGQVQMPKVRSRRNTMPTMLARPFAAVISPENFNHLVPTVSWRFALLLLGLAGALIILSATYPEFFTGPSGQLGPDAP